MYHIMKRGSSFYLASDFKLKELRVKQIYVIREDTHKKKCFF